MKLCSLLLAVSLSSLAATPDVDKAKALGPLTAPVVIEVYSSFACSHCKDFHETILPQLMRDYVTKGKVCVVNREFFPPNFPAALEAANTATAAGRIGKYQAVADALFRNQQQWMSSGKVWDTVAGVLTPAQQKQVQSLAKEPGVVAEVQRDVEMGKTTGITNTPTLWITHGDRKFPIVGVPEYSLLRSFLDGLLK